MIYLGLGQVKRIGKFGPFGDAQILFLPELLLQVQQLLRGERRPGFSVGFVFPQVAFKFWRFAVIGVYKQKTIVYVKFESFFFSLYSRHIISIKYNMTSINVPK